MGEIPREEPREDYNVPMKRSSIDLRIPILLGLTIIFWASAFAGIRAGLEFYSPGHVALVRMLVASAVLALYALLVRMRLPEAGISRSSY